MGSVTENIVVNVHVCVIVCAECVCARKAAEIQGDSNKGNKTVKISV